MNITENILNIFSFIIGILGVILAIIFYYKGKKRKTPVYEISDFNIISDNLEKKVSDISITYKQKLIKTLTVSKVVIWNSGNSTIQNSDIPETNRFRIHSFSNCEIYDFDIISKDDKDCLLELQKIKDGIEIRFNYLEPQSGFIIKVIHSGINSTNLYVAGKIIGEKEIKRIFNLNRGKDKKELTEDKLNRIFILVMGLTGIFVVFGTETGLHWGWNALIFIISIIFVIAALAQIFETKIPKKLKSNFENK
ncbi:hypothetical protein [Polaribacter sp. Hel1_85]|uniref:hypothetical protein n=1 Tax=Polaribacter sp. Hel1_85 TaxID=1250005 RepID=UPI000569E06E|nr:hypothetical protein [Polaribacter sp. Hel1_85]